MTDTEYRERAERRDSSRRAVAHEPNVRDFAALLFVDVEPVRSALLNEPLAEALAMVQWCMEHEGEDFDPAAVLPAWARKRQRGYWRETREPEIEAALNALDGNGNEDELVRYWSENRAQIITELDRMSKERMFECSGCGGRFKGKPYTGERCRGCAKRAGVA